MRNEKHVGDILMQKYYTADFLTKTMNGNNGELEQYYIKDNHPAIVSREDWDAAQLELDRREKFREAHGISKTGSRIYDPLFSRVFCAHCGGKLIRKSWKGIFEVFWKCENVEKRKGSTCNCENISEASLKAAIVTAWNGLVQDREKHLPRWEKQAATGNPLERYRARLMIAVTADGPLEAEIPELTRMFLEEITVESADRVTVKFLDGSKLKVQL